MRRIDRFAAWIPHLVLAGMAVLLLYAVGRPVHTADAWLHLKVGAAYAEQGPWLAADPILYTAEAPPAATAWISQLSLHAIHAATGFQGLRVAHVLIVAAILALAHALLRRASGSAVLASLGTTLFIGLAGYRFLQLRPHLVTIACALLLYRLLLEASEKPPRQRIALAALLIGLWANAHAGFVLGPILLLAATAGVLLAAWVAPETARPAQLSKARALGIALALGFLATFVNPDGPAPHLAYFSAGDDSPALDMVMDEWRPFPFFGPLRPGLPPSALSFATSWLLIAAVPFFAVVSLRRWRRGDALGTEPVLVAIACAGALATAGALRFQWMGVFALLLAAHFGRAYRSTSWLKPAAAGVAVLLAVAWLRVGDWPRLSEGVPRDLKGYAAPYATAPYFGHATWLLRDAGIEGHLFNRYVLGNFLGYWLAPKLRPFFAGSMNVPPDVAEAHFALNKRFGLGHLSFQETLDHYEVDVFMGVGVPTVAPDARPQVYTTTHLEGVEGWTPIFRNIRTALWLRDNARNAENLARIAAYYEVAGVPFDPQFGFDPARVLQYQPTWAAEHGMVPEDYLRLRNRAAAGAPAAQRRLAMLFAALGLYEDGVELDRAILARREESGARRRLVWSLLRLGRGQEALEAAAPLEPAPTGTLARRIADAARAYTDLESPDQRAVLVVRLRVLSQKEAMTLMAGLIESEPR